jgi:CubicO group peptidase (beta-lactamase class C family)
VNDRWHLGSITKSMTATLFARAVEDGVIGWDTTIAEALGPVVPDIHPAFRDLTGLELLSHRAGLVANAPMMTIIPLSEARTPADIARGRQAYAAAVLRQNPVGPARTGFLYSNAGYVVAGLMVEQRLAQSWEAALQARVFAPLGITSAGFGPPGAPGALDQPVGHRKAMVGSRRLPQPPHPEHLADNPLAMGPAGTVHMALGDVLRYLAAHRDRPATLLGASSWERLHTPPFGGDYALGWLRRADGLWHNGSNTFWYAEVLVEGGKIAVAAANDGHLSGTAPTVAQALRLALDRV